MELKKFLLTDPWEKDEAHCPVRIESIMFKNSNHLNFVTKKYSGEIIFYYYNISNIRSITKTYSTTWSKNFNINIYCYNNNNNLSMLFENENLFNSTYDMLINYITK